MNIFKEFVRLYAKYDNISLSEVAQKIETYNTNDNLLTRIWVNSNYTDYSFFNHPDYKYLDLMAFRNLSKGSIDCLKKWVFPNKILDFGGGNGLPVLYLASLFPSSKIYVYDISEQVLEFGNFLKCELGFDNVEFSQVIPNEVFDVVLCLEVLEHNQKPLEFLEEILKFVFKHLLVTVTFTKMWPGHFPYYMVKDKNISQGVFSKLKKEIELQVGIEKVGWNGHPTLFTKRNTC